MTGYASGSFAPDRRLSREECFALAEHADLDALMRAAAARRDAAHGAVVTYSRKVFIPLTRLCRDVCHYCTFAQPPRQGEAAFLTLDEVLSIARAGAAAHCKEALFTLGDKPELRYRAAQPPPASARRDRRVPPARNTPHATAGGPAQSSRRHSLS